MAQPHSLSQAAELLAGGGWRLLAGGTDLYPAHLGRPLPDGLLDLTGISELRGIRQTAQGWWFGATTTWSEVLRAELPPVFDALKQAAREIGGEQIQNVGTLAGNLCNASPAADGTPVWLALDARVDLLGPRGPRSLPVAEFVLGSRRTACAVDELVTGLQVPAWGRATRSAFAKLGGRRYLVISSSMVALALEPDTQGRVQRAGVAVGSCAATALRLAGLEQRLIGLPLAQLRDFELTAQDLHPLQPISDLRASADYRREATLTVLRRALQGWPA
jgi:CO/xanthine dehydrogenase FAD-binding subunit